MLFPALSVATIVIVLEPSTRLTVVENVPSAWTVAVVPLTFRDTGLEVMSLVLPVTGQAVFLVTSLSVGAVTFRVGGTVSILNVTLLCVAALSS